MEEETKKNRGNKTSECKHGIKLDRKKSFKGEFNLCS